MPKAKPKEPYIVRYPKDSAPMSLQDHLNAFAKEGYKVCFMERLDNSADPVFRVVLELKDW
jgi:hypothetical protein